jgi:hypothetical protein
MSGAAVVVEPDSVGAWLGLIGVVAGVAITTGANWLQGSRRDRAERQRELDAATGQVIASATSVIILVQRDPTATAAPAPPGDRSGVGTQAEWAEKITAAVERLQVADQVIQRYGQQNLAKASNRVVYAATDFARHRSGGILAIDEAIKSYTEVLHSGHQA